MTYRTYTHYHCPSCDHRSTLIESENDQPFSKEWSSSREETGDLRRYGGVEKTYAEDNRKCPNCGG